MEVNTDHTEIYRGYEEGYGGHKAACNGIKMTPGGSIGAKGWGSPMACVWGTRSIWHCPQQQVPMGT